MNYQINEEDKIKLSEFKKMAIPNCFKLKYIDYMLFVELVDFDICTYLLNGKEFPNGFYTNALNQYDLFKKNIDILELNEYEKQYYMSCCNAVEIFKKHCSNN